LRKLLVVSLLVRAKIHREQNFDQCLHEDHGSNAGKFGVRVITYAQRFEHFHGVEPASLVVQAHSQAM
jgi:hypothetical protein